jgi:hypothetical protein
LTEREGLTRPDRILNKDHLPERRADFSLLLSDLVKEKRPEDLLTSSEPSVLEGGI